jgi:hypothetical protein
VTLQRNSLRLLTIAPLLLSGGGCGGRTTGYSVDGGRETNSGDTSGNGASSRNGSSSGSSSSGSTSGGNEGRPSDSGSANDGQSRDDGNVDVRDASTNTVAGSVCADGSTCNCLVDTGPVVVDQYVGGPIPTGQGGNFMNGRYHLVARKVYGSNPGVAAPTTRTQTNLYVGTSMQYVQHVNGQPEARVNTIYSLRGNTLTATTTCPMNSAITSTYDISGYDVYIYTPSTSVAEMLTLQP